jgi:hypothetical protein
MQHIWNRRIIVILITILGSVSLSSCTSLIKSKDHSTGHWERSHSNAYLWRRVRDDPAVFYPKDLPRGYPVNPQTGDWIIDPQDRAAFFVPNQECGGLSSGIWRAEAIKAVNRHSKAEQSTYNTVTVLVGWPAFIALTAASGLGS